MNGDHDMTAEEWLAIHHPTELATFPNDDTGRSHSEVSLSEYKGSLYYEQQVDRRPGTHRSPAWRRREALESQSRAIARAEADRLAAIKHRCEHCQIRERPSWAKLCRRCSQHFSRHGKLPPVDEATL